MKIVATLLIAAGASCLGSCGSEPDVSEPAEAAVDGVEYGAGPAETMPATAPGPDDAGPAAEISADSKAQP